MYLTRAGYLKTKCVVSALKLLTLGCGNVFYTFSIYIAGIVSIWGLAAFSLGTKVPRTQGIRDVSISKYFGELLCEILCMNAQDLLCIPEYSSSCNSCNLRECKIVTLVWKILEKVHEVSVQSLNWVQLFSTPWIAACQASLSITNSRSSRKLMSIESVMPSSHLILCRPLLLLPPIPPSIRVFSNESTFRMRWPKNWSFTFSIRPSNEHPGLISFRMV